MAKESHYYHGTTPTKKKSLLYQNGRDNLEYNTYSRRTSRNNSNNFHWQKCTQFKKMSSMPHINYALQRETYSQHFGMRLVKKKSLLSK